ncbi:MAG: hypothetical protein NVS3B12_13320 [Acidimicrobiales bacterium]
MSDPSRPASALLLALSVAVMVVVAACTGGAHRAKPVAPLTPETTMPITTLADHSSDSLDGVSGRTTLTIALTPGQATLGGVVAGPDGQPVPGATVRLERVVGDQLAAANVGSAADGTWTAARIIGGLYRVRAWRAPDLAQTTPNIMFLGSKETQMLNLRLDRFTGVSVSSSLAPNPPIIDSPANLVVAVNAATVGPDGVVRGQGRSGVAVQLFGEGQWQISGSPGRTTNASGIASWQLTCVALGNQPLSVLVNGTDTFPLNLAPCSPVPPTTTTAEAQTTTTQPGQTTTTQPGQTTTTRRQIFRTTTTRP